MLEIILSILIIIFFCLGFGFIYVKIVERIHQKAIDKCIENFSLSTLSDETSGSENN